MPGQFGTAAPLNSPRINLKLYNHQPTASHNMSLFHQISDTLRSWSARDRAGAGALERPETFDDYLRRVIFPKESYELRRVVFPGEGADLGLEPAGKGPEPEETTAGEGPPLYTFRCHATGQEFLVDADFREAVFYPDKVEWCRPGRLKRYQEVSRGGKPVFLTLGLGQRAGQPEALYLVPVSHTSFSGLRHGTLSSYACSPDQAVAAGYLWRITSA